jgi:hypothetical protein
MYRHKQGERNRSPLQQQDGLNSLKSKSSTRQEIIAQSQFRPRREYPPPAVLFQVLVLHIVIQSSSNRLNESCAAMYWHL